MEKIKLNIQLFAEQTLETKITSESKELDQSLDNVIKKLNQLATSINKVNNMINKSNTKKVAKDTDDLANKIGKSVLNAQKLSNALSFTAITAGITRLVNLIDDWVYEASDYSEQLNLFNVIFDNIEKNGKTTFSNLGKSATQFQYKLNESFGTNKTETFYMHGMFQAMGEAVKIPEEYSAIMSETMTKLSYDMASLYNKQETDTAEALRAGVYAGQTKPLRAYGIDVTQMSMQPVLNDLGIDKTVKQLSQAEKEIVRYLATLRQATNAMGDFANTIESPANQLKIFKQQLIETKVAITSLIMNVVNDALPYLNAFLMVIKEIAKWLATLLGIELSSYNSSIANYGYDLEEVGNNADSANKSIAKLKRQALGFDEIHNINENTGSNSGVGSTGGIDQKLLDAIYGYDNGMESVRMKATEIRDRIMEWLGFTKKIDPVTGEISFEYQGIKKTLSNVLKSFLKLNTSGKILAVIITTTLLGSAWSKLKKIFDLIKKSKLLAGAKNLLKPFKELTKLVSIDLKGGLKGLGKALGESHSMWKASLDLVSKIKVGIGGAIGILLGINGAYDSMKSVANEGWNLNNALSAVASEVGLIISGFTLLGPAGAIGAGVIGLITGIISYVDRKKDIEELNKLFENQGVSIESVSNKLIKVFDDSTQYIGTITNLANEYENAQLSVDSTRQKIEEFKNTLDLQDEKISNTQISTLGTYYDELKEQTKLVNQASRNYYIALIQDQANAMGASKTSTASQIADYKLLASTKAGYDEEYIDQEKKLTEAKYTGKISAEEYNEQLKNLQVTYGIIADTSIDTSGAIEGFSKKLAEIDYGSPEEATSAIKSVKDEYANTMNALNEYKSLLGQTDEKQNESAKKQLENLELTKTLQGSLNETQQKIYDNLTTLVNEHSTITEEQIKNVESTIENVQGQYKGYISAIYADLSSRGLETSDEFKGIVDGIKEDLKTLGDVEITGFGKTMFDSMINDIISNKPTALKKLQNEFSTLGIDAGKDFNDAVTSQMQGIYDDMIDNMGDKAIIPDWMEEIGDDSVDGYDFGFTGPQAKIKTQNSANKFANNVIGTVKKGFDSHSPSKAFEKIGNDNVDGLIIGLENKESDLLKTIKNMIAKIKEEFDKVTFAINISSNVESSFNSILSKLQSFVNKFRRGINSLLSNMKTSMNNIKLDGNGKITYTSMPKITISKFADGGIPSKGSMFVAGEAGAEIVGNINGRTEVLNKSQIASAIYSAVLSAMNQVQTSNQIDVHVHTDEGTIVDRVNQKTKQTGVFPFHIPV